HKFGDGARTLSGCVPDLIRAPSPNSGGYSSRMPPIRIVLCRPSHPGNIGAAARAIKAMGLSDLRLVQPERFPAPEAQWMATNAVDVLEAAKVHDTLHDALADCVAAFALSARSREWSPQVLDVRSAAVRAVEMNAPLAFVFGNEADRGAAHIQDL